VLAFKWGLLEHPTGDGLHMRPGCQALLHGSVSLGWLLQRAEAVTTWSSSSEALGCSAPTCAVCLARCVVEVVGHRTPALGGLGCSQMKDSHFLCAVLVMGCSPSRARCSCARAFTCAARKAGRPCCCSSRCL
jgi:hypothetical protein